MLRLSKQGWEVPHTGPAYYSSPYQIRTEEETHNSPRDVSEFRMVLNFQDILCEAILVLGRVIIPFEPGIYESFGIRCIQSVYCISFKFNASRGYLSFFSLSYHLENSLLSGCLPPSSIKLAALSADHFLNGSSSGTYCPISFLHRFRGIVASWHGMPPCMSGCRSQVCG